MLQKIFSVLVDKFLVNYQNKKILNSLPKNLSFIVDVGSHDGQLYQSLIKNSFIFDEIHMFEPYKESFERLSKIQDKRISKYNVALGARPEIKDFSINKYEVTNTFATPNEKLAKFRIKNLIFGSFSKSSYFTKEPIEISTLDKYFNHSLKEIDLLKIDTEGYELEVLKGSLSLLKSSKIRYILLEKHNPGTYIDYEPAEIDKLLINYGFKLDKEFKVRILGFKDCLYKKKN